MVRKMKISETGTSCVLLISAPLLRQLEGFDDQTVFNRKLSGNKLARGGGIWGTVKAIDKVFSIILCNLILILR